MTLRQRLARAALLEHHAAELRKAIQAHACREAHGGALCDACAQQWDSARAMEERARRLYWGRPAGESW